MPWPLDRDRRRRRNDFFCTARYKNVHGGPKEQRQDDDMHDDGRKRRPKQRPAAPFEPS
jgi:hypothetical protein